MPKDKPNEPTTRGRQGVRWRRAAIAAGVLAAVLWAARGLPRKLLQSYLSGALEAQVEIEDLRLEGWRKLTLGGVRAQGFAQLPAIAEVTFDEVVVEGRAREILARRIARLTVRGMSARCVPAGLELDRETPLVIGELDVEPAVLLVTAADPGVVTTLELAGSFRGIGEAAAGRLTIRAPEVELEPLLDLARAAAAPSIPADLGGRLTTFDGTLAIDRESTVLDFRAAEGRLRLGERSLTLADLDAVGTSPGGGRFGLAAGAAGASVAVGGRTLELGAARLSLTAAPAADRPGVLHLELEPALALATGARLAADWDRERSRLLSIDGRAGNVDLGLLVGDAGITGEVDVELATEGPEIACTVTARPRSLAVGTLAVVTPRASVTLTGKLPIDKLADRAFDGLSGPLALALDLPAAAGELDRARPGARPLPAGLFPIRASFVGELVDGGWNGGDPRASVRGRADLTTAAAGRLRSDGELRWADAELTAGLGWSWRGGELPRLVRLLEEVGLLDRETSARFEVGGKVTGEGGLAGRITDPRIDGELHVEGLGFRLADAPWRLANGNVEAEIHRRPAPGQPVAARTELRIRAASADFEHPSLTLPLTLAARLRADPSLRAGTLSEVLVASAGPRQAGPRQAGPRQAGPRQAGPRQAGLGELRFDGGWRTSGEGSLTFDGKLRGEAFEVAAWQEKIGLDAGGVRFRGRLSADLEAHFDATAGWRLHGPATLAAAGASSADGARVVEGLTLDGTVEAGGGAGSPATLRAAGTSGGFVALWDAVFEDVSDASGFFELDAALPAAGGGTPEWRLSARLDVPALGVVESGLEPSAERPGEIAYTLKLDAPDLAATHQRYLRALLEERFERPELGGRLRADLHGGLGSEAGGRLAGEVRLEAVDGALGGRLAVTGLDLHLPLDLRFGEAADGERRRGEVSFESLSFRGLALPGQRSGIWSRGDDLEIEQPLAFRILGGEVTLDQLSLRDLLGPRPFLESSLSFRDLGLGRIAAALDLFPLEGTLAGTFPRFRLSADALEVEGGGEVAVFGGQVAVHGISGKNVLTPFPTLTLSADFEEVDLGKLTRRLDFGEMTGILRGRIEDCEFFRGVPVRCAARFETAGRPGARRTVDVKAINNLSILGTGQKVGPLDRGIHRFLDHYRYQRLGVELRLDEDRLLLRGLERRKGRELFVKGRPPFPIDVVNVQPGRTVSFKTLLRRLKTIDFSTATTSQAE